MPWKIIYRDRRIRRRFQIPMLRVSCYRKAGGWWVAVITCIESCAYITKLYRYKRDAMNDAKEKRREMEKNVDESIASVSGLRQGDISNHGGTSKSKH